MGERNPMKTIYIDADACTVKAETYKVALRYVWLDTAVAFPYHLMH